MKFDVTRKLIARGYWKENDGEGGDLGGAGDTGGAGDGETGDDGGDGEQGGKGSGDDDSGSDDDKPSEKEAALIKEVMKKKGKIKELETQLGNLNSQLKRFEGIDPEAVRELLKQKEEVETKKLEEKGEWEKLKQQILSAHGKEVSGLADELATVKKQLSEKDTLIEKLTIGHSFDSSKYIGEELLLTPSKARVIYGSHFDIEDGKVVGYDKPRGDSGRVQLIGGDGEPLSFEDAMKKIIDTDQDRDNLIRSKARAGAGSSTTPRATPKDSKPKPKGVSRIHAAITEKGGVGHLK